MCSAALRVVALWGGRRCLCVWLCVGVCVSVFVSVSVSVSVCVCVCVCLSSEYGIQDCMCESGCVSFCCSVVSHDMRVAAAAEAAVAAAVWSC
jgi:hypothetical protein